MDGCTPVYPQQVSCSLLEDPSLQRCGKSQSKLLAEHDCSLSPPKEYRVYIYIQHNHQPCIGEKVLRIGQGLVDLPIHDTDELLPHILCSPHTSRLDEVLVAPRIRELARLPSIIHGQQCQVVALGLMEFGFL